MKKISQDLISIAIPIYNETKGVYELIKKVNELKLNKEIIILDDGSTYQETKDIIKKIKKDFPTLTFVESKRNIGKTQIVMQGLRQAKGNIFVILDSDSELDPNDIPHLYQKLISTQARFVNGIRVIPDNKRPSTYSFFITQTAKYFFGIATRLFLGANIQDVMCGYKMFYTEDFRHYTFSTQKFGLETELIGETLRHKRRIEQEYVNYYPRTYKEGKKIQIYDGLEVLEVLLQKSPQYSLAKNLIAGILIFLIAYTSFTFSMRFFNTTDSYPNNFTALNILFNRRLDLTNLKDSIKKRGISSTTVVNSKGVVYSKTPPLIGVLSVPTFALFNTYYSVNFLTPEQIVLTDYSQYIGKLSAAIYVSLSAVLLFFILEKIIKNVRLSSISVLVYIFATNIFNTASQANWQHGFSLFFITLFIYLIISFYKNYFVLFLCGVLGGLMTQLRISNGFYTLFPLIYLYLRKEENFMKKAGCYITGFLLIYLGIIYLNRYFEVPYGYTKEILLSFQTFSPVGFIQNMLGLLFSINYGFFLYSPILLLSLIGLYKLMQSRSSKRQIEIIALLPTLAIFIIFASFWWTWIGGTSLNARMLTEILPIVILLLAYGIQYMQNNRAFKVLFLTLFSVSLFINILSTYSIDWWWFVKYQKGGYKNQIHDAWYSNPSLLGYALQTRFIHLEQMYRKDGHLVVHSLIYRPTLETKQMTKIEDREYILLQLNP